MGPHLSWPNMWAKTEIVPELVGELDTVEVASVVLEYMIDDAKLLRMRQQLAQLHDGPSETELAGPETRSSSNNSSTRQKGSAANIITQEVCSLLLL